MLPSGLPRWTWLAAVAWLILILAPIHSLDSQQYAAWTSALQAFGLLLAFLLGLATVGSDARHRRVDRTYALHQELTNGEIDDARRRLGEFLRERDSAGMAAGWKRLSRERMRRFNRENVYPNDPTHSPLIDSGRLIRFFERARLVQLTGGVDDDTFVALLGSHIVWWDCALKLDSSPARMTLRLLADWADGRLTGQRATLSHITDWRPAVIAAFGSTTPELDAP